MAAPVPTPRGVPTGIKLREGFHIKHTFARNSTIELWEKAVKPPSMDGGDPVEQTTQHNVLYETMAPRTLIKNGPVTFKCAYDPNVYVTALAILNTEDTCTETYPDGSTLAYFGYLQKFEPDEVEIGKQPEATVTVIVTNWDYVNKVEAGPVMTSVSGT
jgi:hypothetical protein